MTTRWVHDLTDAEAPIAGSKATTLGELARAGLAVPDGFVVTAETCQEFMEGARFREIIERRVAHLNVDEPDRLQAAAGRIKKMVLNSELPDDIAAAILEAYREMGRPPVAVRNSPLGEAAGGDSSSLLNVQGPLALLAAVKTRWAAAFDPDAVYYRAHRRKEQSVPGLPVLVQQMVQAAASGVVMTAEPIFNDASRLIVEAVWGLGESIAEATVTPDLYVLDRQGFGVLERHQERQEWKLRRDPYPQDGLHGTRREPVLIDERDQPKLTEDELRDLASLALRVEAHLGGPQEISWARDGAGFWILHAAPLIALGAAGRVAGAGIGARPDLAPAAATR